MKKFLTLLMLTLFSFAICSASVSISHDSIKKMEKTELNHIEKNVDTNSHDLFTFSSNHFEFDKYQIKPNLLFKADSVNILQIKNDTCNDPGLSLFKCRKSLLSKNLNILDCKNSNIFTKKKLRKITISTYGRISRKKYLISIS